MVMWRWVGGDVEMVSVIGEGMGGWWCGDGGWWCGDGWVVV